jgi:hypothetical protein
MSIAIDPVDLLCERVARRRDREQAQALLRFQLTGARFDVLTTDARPLRADLVLLQKLGCGGQMVRCRLVRPVADLHERRLNER